MQVMNMNVAAIFLGCFVIVGTAGKEVKRDWRTKYLTLDEQFVRIKTPWFADLQTACGSSFVFARYNTNAVLHLDGINLKNMDLEDGALIRGVSCDPQGKLYVLFGSKSDCTIRRYDSATSFVEQSLDVPELCFYAQGIVINSGKLYVGAKASIFSWGISADGKNVVGQDKPGALALARGTTLYDPGQFAVDGSVIFVGDKWTKSLSMYWNGELRDVLDLQLVLGTGNIFGPYVTVGPSGYLLVSGHPTDVPQYQGTVLAIGYSTSSGFNRVPPRMLLQSWSSTPHQLCAAGDRLAVYQTDPDNSEIRLYNIVKH